jgi:hypothetical protein
MERTVGFEPAFSTPITVHRCVAGVGYVRALGGAADFNPVFLLEREVSRCARRRELAPRPGLEPEFDRLTAGVLPLDDREMVDRRSTAPRATILRGSSAPLCAARTLSWFRSTLSCSSGRRFHQISLQGELERPAGYDPASRAWQAETLRLGYGGVVGRDRVELPQHRGGAFTAPWVRRYPAYP